jgi:catechol 2,3-dioxygenase-like lactoylglutathione lyase family enzyme
MRIKLTSIMVDEQEKGLRFYTEVLGFRKKHDVPVGEYLIDTCGNLIQLYQPAS